MESNTAAKDTQKNLSDLWAKDTKYSLLNHSLDVVRVTEQVCEQLPFSRERREELVSIARQIAALHDVGKAALGFQEMLRGKSRSWHRHEILSAAVAMQIVPELCDEGLLAVITHHKNILPGVVEERGEKYLPSNELPFIEPNCFGEMVSELQINKTLLIELLLTLNETLKLDWKVEALDFDEMNLHRLDNGWLQRKRPFGQRFSIEKSKRRIASELRGVLITSDHMASAFKKPLSPLVLSDSNEKVRRDELKNKTLRPFQERSGETTGDAILKAPTGSGKTAAILLWAAQNQIENGRLFYVLPHTASINAMHQRLKKIYSEDAVGVLHHKNASYLFRLYERECCAKEAASMAKTIAGLARELYHPVRVSTPHQILRVALQGKGWELGLLEFSNACFVFDEIHVFEPLLMGLTIATAKWLQSLGARLLFASATIPKFMEKILRDELGIKNIISPDPNLSGDKEVCDKIRHKIEVREGSLLINLPQVFSEIQKSNETALIVCNHVATSQQVYDAAEREFEGQTILLHSRFNSHDRTRIESIITSKNPPRILVATQAVEVSLDLDYQRGYTEPAPADALGQRFGRINRSGNQRDNFGNLKPASVVVFSEPSNGYLYDENLTNKTVDFLRTVGTLSEQALTRIVNEVYADGYQGNALELYKRGLVNDWINNFNEKLEAGAHRAWVEDVIEKSDGQIEVLPIEGISEGGIRCSIYDEFITYLRSKIYLQAKELLVPIRVGQWRKLVNERTVYYEPSVKEWCVKLKYSARKGLDLSGQIENIL